jgi:hypothetical protein
MMWDVRVVLRRYPQVMARAALDAPHIATARDAHAGATLVAMFAGDYTLPPCPGLPIALPFSRYHERCCCAAAGEAVLAPAGPAQESSAAVATQAAEEARERALLPDKVYKVGPELLGVAAAGGGARRMQFLPNGLVLSSSALCPLSVSCPAAGVTLVTAPSAATGTGGGSGSNSSISIGGEEPGGVAAQADMDAAALAGVAGSSSCAHQPMLVLTTEAGRGNTLSVYQANWQPAAGDCTPAAASEGAGAANGEPPDTPAAPNTTPRPPQEPPVLAVSVHLPSGGSVELTTRGQVVARLPPPPRAAAAGARDTTTGNGSGGGEVNGSQAAVGATVGLVGAPLVRAVVYRGVTPGGAMVTGYADGGLRVVHPDGSVSERLSAVDGWVVGAPPSPPQAEAAPNCTTQPDDGVGQQQQPAGAGAGGPSSWPAAGWLRTLAGGQRFREPDAGSVRVPRLVPQLAPPPAEPEAGDAIAAGKKKPAGKKKTKVRRGLTPS